MTAGEHRDVAFDAVSLGEVMLRLDPGTERIRTARTFQAWEGGGEYNVVRALRKCFGHRSAVATALVDNEIGRLVEDLVCQGGVDTSLVRWAPFDGIGRYTRNGLNFTERGFGVREALGVSDRGHSATAALAPDDVDWARLFGTLGVRVLHTGGVFAGLSPTTPDVAEEAMATARAHGTLVSYDLNFRSSLWQDAGGVDAAIAANRRLLHHVDVLIGNERHLSGLLGLDIASDADIEQVAKALALEFPGVAAVGVTRRGGKTIGTTDWGAAAWAGPAGAPDASRTPRPGPSPRDSAESTIVSAQPRTRLPVLDRVGSGDAFAAGFLHALLTGRDLQDAVDLGAAAGALAMTTPGDALSATRDEVDALARGEAPILRR